MISEKIELLGKGLYKDIPDVLTLKAIPTASELDYVSSEDFDQTMIDKILPKAIEEKINFHDLLEIDFQWICRCLRFVNYGPYYTTNRIYCSNCGTIPGEARVDLRSVKCKPLPEDFVNDIVITKDQFIDFQGDVHLHLPTIQEIINAHNDKVFSKLDGSVNREFARICYMIKSVGKESNMTALSAKIAVEKQLSSADYIILKNKVTELTDYGLRAGGSTTCPRCHRNDAAFIALVDDRFLRPTVGDLLEGRDLRSAWATQDVPGDTEDAV